MSTTTDIPSSTEYTGGHPLTHPDDFTLRLLGVDIPVPKGEPYQDEDGNWHDPHSEWRDESARDAAEFPEDQANLMALCADGVEGCIFWINRFVYTFEQQAILDDGQRIGVSGPATNVPFVTWPVQDAAIRDIFHAIEQGHDLVVDKSRQMGATWLLITVFVWFCIFRPNSIFIVLSSTEELVDNSADPFSIFFKIDYILQRLPGWMVASKSQGAQRSHMKWSLPNGSAIHGRSTSTTKGRGGACTACMIDEAADIRFLEALWTAFGQSTPCRIVNSTPKGPGFYYTLVESVHIPKLILDWSDHPIKGRDRYIASDPETGERYIASPWFDNECRKAGGRKTRQIAQELGRDHLAAGQVFFDLAHLSRQEMMYCRAPWWVGDLIFTGEERMEDIWIRRRDPALTVFRDRGFGPWKLWTELVPDAYGRMRPRQDRTYIFGIDIGHGLGMDKSSNSVIWVIERETREQVAMFVSAEVEPSKLAVIAARAGYWFGGGSGLAFIGWENNGPGQTFTKHMRRLNYGWVLKPVKETKGGAETQATWGWTSSASSKVDLLGETRSMLNRDKVMVRDRDTLKEARTYVFWGDSGVGPGWLGDDMDGSKQTHGDRVIGMAVACYCVLWSPMVQPITLAPPRGSAAERWAEAEQEERDRDRPY